MTTSSTNNNSIIKGSYSLNTENGIHQLENSEEEKNIGIVVDSKIIFDKHWGEGEKKLIGLSVQ